MPPTGYVYATAACTAADAKGDIITMREGEPWAEDDPFVVSRPEFFSTTPPAPNYPRRTVEQATAGPGERRAVRRG